MRKKSCTARPWPGVSLAYSPGSPLPNIFAYLNYRDFLRDFYQEQKAKNPVFSYQYFANRAGFKSKSFLKLVIDGRKNLTGSSLEKMAQAMKLSPKAFSYFEDL